MKTFQNVTLPYFYLANISFTYIDNITTMTVTMVTKNIT